MLPLYKYNFRFPQNCCEHSEIGPFDIQLTTLAHFRL
jgi:hypothetical protein